MTPSERPRFGWTPKLLFCSGAIANTVKSTSIQTFLLVFYNQAVGLPPALVGTAIMITLIFDAIVDPTVGQISDNIRSPWGRRHPLMYASALPLAVGFVLLWNPPAGASQSGLFAYLLACLMFVRLLDTFFELPSGALVPELAPGYDERTTLLSIRSIFGLLGGLAMTILAYQVFMKENSDGSGGVTERHGYLAFSLTAAGVIVVAILTSAIATHRFIPYLAPAPTRRLSAGGVVREIGETLRNWNFAMLVLMGVLNAIAGGLYHSLQLYFGLYFWELTQAQLSMLALAGTISAFAGAALAPFAGGRFGKKPAAIVFYATALCIMVGPVLLRVLNLAPPNGTAAVFWLILVAAVVSQTLAIATTILLASMLSDVVEEVQVATGRRAEGLVFSADQLFKKIVSGVGVFISGVLLAYVNFPKNAQRGAVDPEVLRSLALGYLPIFFLFAGAGAMALLLLRTTRQSHEANLEVLRQRAVLAAAAEAEATDPLTPGGAAPAAAAALGRLSEDPASAS